MNTISLENKSYDKPSKALTGFDIVFDKERIHVDLSNYFPVSKTESEVRQIREDIYKTYQIAMTSNYHSKDVLLMSIAKNFPDGITWISPGQKEEQYINTNLLHMQGRPDMSFSNGARYGEAFLELHDLRSSSQKNNIKPCADYGNTKLAEAMSIGDNNAHLSNAQMHTLSCLIAENINKKLHSQQSCEPDATT